jgi:hypothetical protein
MEVIRDDTWHKIFKDVSATCHDENYCTRFANAAWRYRAKAREIEARRDSRRVRILKTKRETTQKKTSGLGFCQGKTKSGQPCRFKASCGGYCKKHTSM